MDSDDLDPITRKTTVRDLSPLSVEELADYIAALEAEVSRAKDAIAAKKTVRAGAEALFK